MEIIDTAGEVEGKLPYELRKNRFDYKIVKRSKDVAIYAQYDNDGSNRILAYEVFRVTWKKGATIGKQVIEPGEKFPGDGDFGKTAYSCSTLEKANKRFDELTELVNNKTIK
jgi:hypothetical protein